MADQWQDRIDIFKVSYQEVLLAIKHQDDKLNRSLTAVAFLTAGGIALYTNFGAESPLIFDDQGVRVSTFYFLTFLTSVAFTLLLALAAIGPSSDLSQRSATLPPSLLFYAAIARDKHWDGYIGLGSAELRERLATDFHREAKVLSHRVSYKVVRAREAGAFLHVVVVSLGLLGIFSLKAIGEDARWWIAAAFQLFLLALPLWDGWWMNVTNFTEGETFRLGHENYQRLIQTVLFSATLLILGRVFHWHWWAAGYAIGALAATRLALVRTKHATNWMSLATGAGMFLVLVLIAGGT